MLKKMRRIKKIILIIIILSLVSLVIYYKVNNKKAEITQIASEQVEEENSISETFEEPVKTTNSVSEAKEQDEKTNSIKQNSEELKDNYFKEIKKVDSNQEKENMLIVSSSSKIENTFGAQNIIEAPNNQYILQYKSEEEKDEALNKLKEDKSISSVEKNIKFKIEETTYNSWGIEKMALDYAMNSSKEELLSNVTVAVIDTGCDIELFNKYYEGKIIETYDVLENSTEIMTDECGHGTHVTGTIAEATPSNVKIIPIKVSEDGEMYMTDIIAAINYITYNKKADVINMSFGAYEYSDALEQAINVANEENIICVAAAGNDNTIVSHYPSAFSNTISIASVNSNLRKSSFSNYGSEITFTAPGDKIKSLMSKNTTMAIENGNTDGDDDHETISGTSMATPHAASAVAILKSYNKHLTLDDVTEILKTSAIDLGRKGWDMYYGYGLISFENVEFREDEYNTDDYGVYKSPDKEIKNIELAKLNFTKYNYYSLTNILGSTIKVYYSDNTSKEMLLWKVPNIEILNYEPTEEKEQTITIRTGNISIDINVTNPDNYESGWEYDYLGDNQISITGYKSHGLNIGKLYVPETINSAKVVQFDNNLQFSQTGDDFSFYRFLYLPSEFKALGDYSLSNTNIKYVYIFNNNIDFGDETFNKENNVLLYVHKDSNAKKIVVSKGLNYRHLEPDEIEVTNEKKTYKELESVDLSSISVKLIYHEEKDREEILLPISNEVGFFVTYQNGSEFQLGDTYYTVTAKNEYGYEISKKVNVEVKSLKTVITPNISVNDKIYDGKTTILASDITVSNLKEDEYSIVSATSSSADVGERIATIRLKLSDEKFEEYSFEDKAREKDFEVKFNIVKAKLYVEDSSDDVTIEYDGEPHSIKLDLEYDDQTILKYMDENGEYTLDDAPEYTEIGKYITKYKLYKNENYTEYLGEKTLTITEEKSLVGDIDGDGEVTLSDAFTILRNVILGNPNMSSEEIKIMDYDGDGEVTLSDAFMILRSAILSE